MANFADFINSGDFSEEVKEAIIARHNETVEGLQAEIDASKAIVQQYQQAHDELQKLKDTPRIDYEAEYNKLNNEFQAMKAAEKKRINHEKKANAYKTLLLKLGVRHSERIINASYDYIEGLEVDEGKIRNSAEVEAHILEEWGAFIPNK